MKLYDVITKKIRKFKAIPFDEFMEITLYHPEFGYYKRKDIKIGREGDFFTASHLGSVFGFLLSRQIEIFYKKLNFSGDFTVTEIGPGMGYLAKDILDALKESNFLGNLKYNLVEINDSLVDIQKERLYEYRDITYWYNSVNQLNPFNGVIICNEIFDAFPVRVFEIRNKPMEVYVTLNEKGEIVEELKECRPETLRYIEEFCPSVLNLEGYRSEINLSMKSFIKSLSRILKKGFILIFDYGYKSEEYYHPSRNRGTLLCYYKHNVHDNPYINIGQQDITAHVNFSAIEKWAKEEGFIIETYDSQSKYLLSLCDEKLLERINEKNLIQQFKRLVLPHGMGETHRVMLLKKYLKCR